MNILHYFLGFPPLHDGGLMIYATNLAEEQLKMGHKVFLLMPGEYISFIGKSKIKYYGIQESLPIYKIVNSHPFTLSGIKNPKKFIKPKNKNNYSLLLKNLNIEVLHVHSLIGFPKEILVQAKRLGIKTVFTTHDYFGICPRVDLFKYNHIQCDDYKSGSECVLCNLNASNKTIVRRNIQLLIPSFYDSARNIYKRIKKTFLHPKKKKEEILHIESNLNPSLHKIDQNKAKRFTMFREYYKNIIENFDLIIFNSSITKREFFKYINIDKNKTKILHVTHSSIKDNRNKINYAPVKDGKVNFTYMGPLNYKKGFFDLVDVFKRIKNNYSNWQLNIYGDCSHLDLKPFHKDFFKFYGKYTHNDFNYIFSNSSLLIIPSKCKETFGFIGLEAFSHGIPAIVSENVGFGDLIENKLNGVIYTEDKDNKNLEKEIINILKNPEFLLKYNKEIKEGEFLFDISNHCKKVLDIYKGSEEFYEDWDPDF